jgi:uncharacterized SAM-dependent methyltransferase
MLYLKNVDLAETYHVSLRTVLNWIEAAKQGKLELALHTRSDKTYIANTARNIATIEKIVAERKKYRNTRGHKVVSPKAELYQLCTKQQIFDIASSLEVAHELPHQYNYLGKGAHYWDEYAKRMAAEETPNSLNSTLKLLAANESYIDGLLSIYKKVNVVDVGVGNAMPVRDLLQKLKGQGKLGRYIALDISAEMLAIAQQNVHDWFDGQVGFEGHLLDVAYDRFNQIFAGEYLNGGSKDTINLVLVFGGTLNNLKSPAAAMRIIHDSMGRNDLMLYTQKLDTALTRKYFDFGTTNEQQRLFDQDKYMLDLLGIDESYYDVEMGYESQWQQRYIRIRLKHALTLKFEFGPGNRNVDFNKDDAIILWRSWHKSGMELIQQFYQSELDPIHVSQSQDGGYILVVSRVKQELDYV